jgi:hypothetical protein
MKYLKIIQFGDKKQCSENGVYGFEYNFGVAEKLRPTFQRYTAKKDTDGGYTCAPHYGTTFSLTFIY